MNLIDKSGTPEARLFPSLEWCDEHPNIAQKLDLPFTGEKLGKLRMRICIAGAIVFAGAIMFLLLKSISLPGGWKIFWGVLMNIAAITSGLLFIIAMILWAIQLTTSVVQHFDPNNTQISKSFFENKKEAGMEMPDFSEKKE